MISKFCNKMPKIHGSAYIAESAEIIGDVRIAKNASIWPGAVLRGDMHYIEIGENTNVQDNSVMHGTADKFPTILGKNVSVGHNAIVHGCTIGDNCIIGMGSIILEGATIGKWCIIGAGAVVTEGAKIQDSSIALGIPARVAGKITPSHRLRISRNWRAYVSLMKKYKNRQKA